MKKVLIGMFVLCASLVSVNTARAYNNTLTPQTMTVNGSTPTYTGSLAAGTTSYAFRNDGRTFLHFKKTGAGECTVTVVTFITVRGLAVDDTTATVGPTSGDVMIGPFEQTIYNDGNGDVSFTFDESTNLSVAVIKL